MRVVDIKKLPELVGQELGVSDWVTIDQGLIDRFADISGDHQWIHVDVDRATQEIGGTIAHGFLTLSMMSTLTAQILRVTGYTRSINYGCNKLRFTGAVPAGSRLRLRAKLISVDPKPDRVIFLRECVMEVEGQAKPVLYAEWLTMLVL